MLSIIIPTYNVLCQELVLALQNACLKSSVSDCYEIIVGDDASTDPEISRRTKNIAHLSNCSVITMETNVGKARMVNQLAKIAKYDNLLMIDSDARLYDISFIENYIDEIKNGYDVVCGGIMTDDEEIEENRQLRYKYELSFTNLRNLYYRSRHPFEYFSTFNVLIRKDIFEKIQYNKRCTKYGYEDTVLGLDLKDMGYNVRHIDNPLIHTGIDSNENFVKKTENSLEILASLDMHYQKQIKVSKFCLMLKKYKILPIITLLHRLFGNVERRNIIANSNLTLFKWYKIGYFSSLIK
ncbi:MAG: glycosyltransferase family 2 protein [Prevotellaceae bacterium]|nr:glycosyltransferase family 2 protein [Candidatus Faecinaster equi]